MRGSLQNLHDLLHRLHLGREGGRHQMIIHRVQPWRQVLGEPDGAHRALVKDRTSGQADVKDGALIDERPGGDPQ